MGYEGLPARLAMVHEVIAARQARAGLDHPVRVIAVTKTHGPDAVRAALAAGIADIGENRVQEALGKQDALGPSPAIWHLIGGLQRNKARQAVGRFALIHSVDRPELAEELARRVPPGGRQAVLVEVNCSGEPQKGGVAPEALPALLDRLAGLPVLDVRGLMTMAPFTTDEDVQRACFRRLRELRERQAGGGDRLPELSMGMSGDYPIAVEEGATMIRLGTLLFGERMP